MKRLVLKSPVAAALAVGGMASAQDVKERRIKLAANTASEAFSAGVGDETVREVMAGLGKMRKSARVDPHAHTRTRTP